MEQKYRNIHLGKAACGLDLGDGSERAEYVNQDYILWKLKRPHRCVNIMYTLYPHDEQWPQRISEACKDMEIHFQWDYPYDDYFPYGADGQPFEQMKDIRRHGQDVLLTLTVDCGLSDDELRAVARDLRPFGRMRIRINHECTGDWFTHNKRYSFEEIGQFFVRFDRIIKEEAPNVQTILCAGFLKDDGSEMEQEKALIDAYKAADIWSADRYLALHYGWPYDVAEAGGGKYTATSVDYTFEAYKKTAAHLTKLCGKKPMTTAEFNVDGDVTGAAMQGEAVKRFAWKVRDEKADWFQGISMYQFRDRGRLGLEQEDPNNKAVGIEQPLMKDYQEVLEDPYFNPVMTEGEQVQFPAVMRWGGSEDADGIAVPVTFEKQPDFCEITFEDETGIMLHVNGRWFYKAPRTKTIDLMPAFWEKPVAAGETVTVSIFAPPADGVNPQTDREDWATNYYAELKSAPMFRIRYEVPGKVM